jgi:hypothetical protein
MDKEQKDAEGNKLSDKKRKAMERQRQMMESFAFQREEFAKKNLNVTGTCIIKNETRVEDDFTFSVCRRRR